MPVSKEQGIIVQVVRLSLKSVTKINLQTHGSLNPFWKWSYLQVPIAQASGEPNVGCLCRRSMIFRIVYCLLELL